MEPITKNTKLVELCCAAILIACIYVINSLTSISATNYIIEQITKNTSLGELCYAAILIVHTLYVQHPTSYHQTTIAYLFAMYLFEGLLNARPPPLQTLIPLTPSEVRTSVPLKGSAALTGKRPLVPCKVASTARGHSVGAGPSSIHSALAGENWPHRCVTVCTCTYVRSMPTCFCNVNMHT